MDPEDKCGPDAGRGQAARTPQGRPGRRRGRSTSWSSWTGSRSRCPPRRSSPPAGSRGRRCAICCACCRRGATWSTAPPRRDGRLVRGCWLRGPTASSSSTASPCSNCSGRGARAGHRGHRRTSPDSPANWSDALSRPWPPSASWCRAPTAPTPWGGVSWGSRHASDGSRRCSWRLVPASRDFGTRAERRPASSWRTPGQALYLDQVESRFGLRCRGWVGRRVPLEGTSVGAAFGDPSRAHVVADAVDAGVTAITCALPGVEPTVGVSIIGPSWRLEERGLDQLALLVQSAANELAEAEDGRSRARALTRGSRRRRPGGVASCRFVPAFSSSSLTPRAAARARRITVPNARRTSESLEWPNEPGLGLIEPRRDGSRRRRPGRESSQRREPYRSAAALGPALPAGRRGSCGGRSIPLHPRPAPSR